MDANNFVQELSNSDYLVFAKKILYLDDKYELASINEEEEYVRVELKRKGILSASKVIMIYRDFDYTIQLNGKTHKDDIKTQTEWRAFMAKKFGQEYISAYSKFVDEYIAKKEKAINALRLELYNEILDLRDKFVN